MNARGLYKRLQSIKDGGLITLSSEDVTCLLINLHQSAQPNQSFACVCGERDFGPEDYRDVEDGSTLTCDECGVTILRCVTSGNALIVCNDEGTLLKDVTKEYADITKDQRRDYFAPVLEEMRRLGGY